MRVYTLLLLLSLNTATTKKQEERTPNAKTSERKTIQTFQKIELCKGNGISGSHLACTHMYRVMDATQEVWRV